MAQKYDLIIVEDDPYRLLYLPADPEEIRCVLFVHGTLHGMTGGNGQTFGICWCMGMDGNVKTQNKE